MTESGHRGSARLAEGQRERPLAKKLRGLELRKDREADSPNPKTRMGERPSPECGPLHGRRSFRESKIDQGSHPQHKLKRGGPVAPAEKNLVWTPERS